MHACMHISFGERGMCPEFQPFVSMVTCLLNRELFRLASICHEICRCLPYISILCFSCGGRTVSWLVLL